MQWISLILNLIQAEKASSINWTLTAQIAAALLGGGAMGAIITATITYYRNRRQPVSYKKEVIEVFKKNPDYDSLQALLMVGSNPSGPGFPVDNYSVARFTLTNKGNQDIGEFEFGVTLEGSNEAVDIKVGAPDRHHVMKVLTSVSLATPTKELDFILQPFNRGDTYSFNVYFTYKDSAGQIHLSSPHSTKFSEIISTGDLQFRADFKYLIVPVIGALFSLLLLSLILGVMEIVKSLIGGSTE